MNRTIARHLCNLVGKRVRVFDNRNYVVDQGVLSYVPQGSGDKRVPGYHVSSPIPFNEIREVSLCIDRSRGIIKLNVCRPLVV
jgi:hypothetical protein